MIDDEMEHDRVPLGFYTMERGHYLVNLKDVAGTQYHPDSSRLNGCCGLDGMDGMNVLCANGHEVGTEQSDCWVSHAVTFDRSAVWLDRIYLDEPPAPESK